MATRIPKIDTGAANAGTIPDMRAEPALSIGELFADTARLKALVTAVIGVLVVAGINVAPGVADNVVTILNMLVPLVLAYIGGQAMTAQARSQAVETRDHVFAPATVEQIAAQPNREAAVTAALDQLERASKPPTRPGGTRGPA